MCSQLSVPITHPFKVRPSVIILDRRVWQDQLAAVLPLQDSLYFTDHFPRRDRRKDAGMLYRCSPLPLVASVSLGYHPEKLSNTLAQMLVRNRLIIINTMPTDTWYPRPYESISAEPCGPCTTLSSRWKLSLPCASYAPPSKEYRMYSSR